MTTRIVCFTLLALAGLGCTAEVGSDAQLPYTFDAGLEPEIPAEIACDGPTYDQVTAFRLCVNCHASTKLGADRKSAPVGVNFDTATAAGTRAAQAAVMVMSGVMPPITTGVALTVEEKRQLYAWAMCKTAAAHPPLAASQPSSGY